MIFKRAKYYKNCDELPLYNFIQILVTGDLNYLLIQGSRKNLKSIWGAIYSEYCTISSNDGQMEVLNILKQLTYTGNKIYMISTILESLNSGYNEELASKLQFLGINVLIDTKDSETYQNSLKRIASLLKNMIFSYDKLKEDFQKISSKNDVKKSDYDNLLTELSKYQGYRLDSKVVSVSEFVSILNSYLKYVKSLNKNSNGK